MKKFTCFDCHAKFKELADLNRHIAKTGCYDTKPFTVETYLVETVHFLFKPHK